MTALYWLLAAAAGGLVAGAVRVTLRVEERIALAVVIGLLGSAVCGLGLSTVFGIGRATALGGPLLLAVIGLLGCVLSGGVLDSWRESVAEVPARWHSRELMVLSAVVVVAVAGFAVLFSHTLFDENGAIVSNFSTVWADWSMHATTANGFALGHNLPPTDPIFSGTTLLYPFLPDFQSGMLVTLGSGIGAALAVPSAVLCVAILLLIVSVARRLTGSLAVGVLAMAMCMLGGGLGVEGLYWDACTAQGTAAAQCAPGQLVSNPAGAIGTALHTVGNAPGTIAAQPRSYDALLKDQAHPPPLDNLQWYTPLLAWWLPQRPFLYGFAIALCVFLLILAARGQPGRRWSPLVIAGLLWGLLPLVHVHSFIALVIVVPLLALFWRRREWLAMGALAALLAAPRLLQLATSGEHGASALGNTFPWLEPGWMSGAIPTAASDHRGFGVAAVFWDLGSGLRVLVTPEWWGFWVANCGIVLPLMVVIALSVAARRAPQGSRLRSVGERVSGLVSGDLLRFTLPFLAIFALGNLVVFQSWDWDNTKLFSYWFFAGALLIGAIVVRLWRGAWWRRTLGTLGFVSVIMTGTVVMLRFLPWTPATDNAAGPFTWEDATAQSLAAQVEQRTPPSAVILTTGRHTDPLLTLAGRRTVMGYDGWLWSYGIDYRRRQGDVAAMYQGCTGGLRSCAATELLHFYGVSYVEIPTGEYVSSFPQGNLQWWAQTYPEVARAGDTVVYDVRP
ncbi:MAG TPA: hypothetical protein VN193_04550 [Candidatus Angelobacter sp.]|nr:hypothetical protein [Candidatus Angelobacter sp.]